MLILPFEAIKQPIILTLFIVLFLYLQPNVHMAGCCCRSTHNRLLMKKATRSLDKLVSSLVGYNYLHSHTFHSFVCFDAKFSYHETSKLVSIHMQICESVRKCVQVCVTCKFGNDSFLYQVKYLCLLFVIHNISTQITKSIDAYINNVSTLLSTYVVIIIPRK